MQNPDPTIIGAIQCAASNLLNLSPEQQVEALTFIEEAIGLWRSGKEVEFDDGLKLSMTGLFLGLPNADPRELTQAFLARYKNFAEQEARKVVQFPAPDRSS